MCFQLQLFIRISFDCRGSHYSFEIRHGKDRDGSRRKRIVCTQVFDFFGDVQNLVAVHLDNGIRNVEESPGTSGHQNGGDTAFSV